MENEFHHPSVNEIVYSQVLLTSDDLLYWIDYVTM
jgi:hypothetical protein